MKVAVYGLGKLGFPLASVISRTGFDTVGIDPIFANHAITHNEPNIAFDLIEFQSEPVESDVSFIVVPTPSLPDGSFDASFVKTALASIRKVNRHTHTAVIVSTVSPGTCDEMNRLFANSTASQGNRFSIVYNPTFIAIGNVVAGLTNPDLLLIGGVDEVSKAPVIKIWNDVFHHFRTSKIGYHSTSFIEVELLKLSINAVLGTKISLANSLGRLFHAYGVPAKSVQIIGEDHRIGKDFLLPGSPITGPCLPRDNAALIRAASHVFAYLPIAEATNEVNVDLLDELYDRTIASNPKTVGILGISYKYGTEVDTDSVCTFLEKYLKRDDIEYFAYDETMPGDSLEIVLEADVIVITQPEYRRLRTHIPTTTKVIDLWE